MNLDPTEPGITPDNISVQNTINSIVIRQDLQADVIHEFVNERLRSLQERSVARTLTFDSGVLRGFISADSVLHPGESLPGFKLDDESIYLDFMKELNRMKMDPSRSAEVLDLPYAVLRTVSRYFAGTKESQGTTNTRIEEYKKLYLMLGGIKKILEDKKIPYGDIVVPIDVFKGQGLAHCLEIAASAHNLFIFAGVESAMVLSDKCEIPKGNKVGHAYNIIRRRNGLAIFDATASIMLYNEDGNIFQSYPDLHSISSEEFSAIATKDGTIEVGHPEYVVSPSGLIEKSREQLVYAG